jgi:hypothetical protein
MLLPSQGRAEITQGFAQCLCKSTAAAVDDLPRRLRWLKACRKETLEKMATKNRNAPPARSYSLISDDTLRQLYASMVHLRARAQGRRGLEAVLAATTVQLRAGDLVFAPDGLVPARPFSHSTHESPVLATTHLAMAAGAAIGRKAAGGDGVVIVFIDALPKNHAVWREALQLAGDKRLPIIFVLLPQSNGTRAAMGVASIASEATRVGVIAIPVDAADAVAIYRVAFESLARARRGTGATLIIATHFKLEDAPRHKTSVAQDPLAHMRAYLRDKGLLKVAAKKKAR